MLKCALGAFVLETVVQHQPLDDPAADAELVKPRRRIAIQRARIRE
jgi:hypothetical protein